MIIKSYINTNNISQYYCFDENNPSIEYFNYLDEYKDLTKNTNAKTIEATPLQSAKQSRWLTKNRFWKLEFLSLLPFQAKLKHNLILEKL